VDTNNSLEDINFELDPLESSDITTNQPKYAILSFKLYQNYPNPFNPETTIKYDLLEDSEVILTIYNLMGKKIRTLVNEAKRAGYHNAVWDGTDDLGQPVASGIYVYQLKADRFSDVRSMVMLK